MIYDIIDAYHGDEFVGPLTRLYEAGIRAVIHKATQGSTFVDPAFAGRVPQFLGAGLQVGAYHFATGEDALEQAKHFLSVVSKTPSVKMLVVDLESNPGDQATVEIGAEIARVLRDAAGYWPVCYMGRYGPLGNGTGLPNATLSMCPLWLPKFGPEPTLKDLPPGWTNWLMWQCTDGTQGPFNDPIYGVKGGYIDRSWFAGSEGQRRVLFERGWPKTDHRKRLKRRGREQQGLYNGK